MKIGIIGCGVVGGTILKGYKTLGFNAEGWNRDYKHNLEKVFEKDALFICLPTVAKDDGTMDMSPFEEVFENIKEYKGLVIIKSTVLPGTTKGYQKKYPNLKIVHSPEFLTEKNAMMDFFKPDRVVLGTDGRMDIWINLFYDLHHIFNVPIIEVDSNTSELMKFMSNCFFATKISFANEMNAIAEVYGADYNKAKEILYLDKRIGNDHLSINKEKAYGGMCLPKDVNQLLADLKNKKIIPNVLTSVKEVNERNNKLVKFNG